MAIGKRCSCGIIVYGTTQKHLESNIKIHIKSRLHKELIKSKTK